MKCVSSSRRSTLLTDSRVTDGDKARIKISRWRQARLKSVSPTLGVESLKIRWLCENDAVVWSGSGCSWRSVEQIRPTKPMRAAGGGRVGSVVKMVLACWAACAAVTA